MVIRDQPIDLTMDEELAVTATTGPVTPAPSSTKAMRHPARPGFGTVGMRCVVKANHFLVEVANRDLHHYDVSDYHSIFSFVVSCAVRLSLSFIFLLT